MDKKSPILAKPLRYAGQSLDEKLQELVYEKILLHGTICIFSIYIIWNEWWRYYHPEVKNPWVLTSIWSFIFLFGIFKIFKVIQLIKNVKLGREGERAVGQYLESLREKGHRVFHDIVGENFNLDHVIISKKGIFVIETKTYSKPIKG